jgi:hypothetical protein
MATIELTPLGVIPQPRHGTGPSDLPGRGQTCASARAFVRPRAGPGLGRASSRASRLTGAPRKSCLVRHGCAHLGEELVHVRLRQHAATDRPRSTPLRRRRLPPVSAPPLPSPRPRSLKNLAHQDRPHGFDPVVLAEPSEPIRLVSVDISKRVEDRRLKIVHVLASSHRRTRSRRTPGCRSRPHQCRRSTPRQTSPR